MQVRKYRELRHKNILKNVLPHTKIEKYLPDRSGGRYKVDEWFVLAIVNKLEPEWFKATS